MSQEVETWVYHGRRCNIPACRLSTSSWPLTWPERIHRASCSVNGRSACCAMRAFSARVGEAGRVAIIANLKGKLTRLPVTSRPRFTSRVRAGGGLAQSIAVGSSGPSLALYRNYWFWSRLLCTRWPMVKRRDAICLRTIMAGTENRQKGVSCPQFSYWSFCFKGNF